MDIAPRPMQGPRGPDRARPAAEEESMNWRSLMINAAFRRRSENIKCEGRCSAEVNIKLLARGTLRKSIINKRLVHCHWPAGRGLACATGCSVILCSAF
jgi:hypothetical protein